MEKTREEKLADLMARGEADISDDGRIRVIVAKTAGFCFGVSRSVRMAETIRAMMAITPRAPASAAAVSRLNLLTKPESGGVPTRDMPATTKAAQVTGISFP